jgi:hypothetical protein
MPFTIPNLGAASHDDQAFPNQADIDALTAGIGGNGVTSGCTVTPQGSPNMTVHVAAGVLSVGTSAVSVSAGDVTITAASSNPRRDLVVSNLSGTLSVVAGTPVAIVPTDPTVVPVLPTLSSSNIALAAVDVPGNTTTITSAEIVDKRVLLSSGIQTVSVNIVKPADESVANNTLQNDDDLFFAIGANQTWSVTLSLGVRASSLGDFQHVFSVPSGAIGQWMDFGAFGAAVSSHAMTTIATSLTHGVSSTSEGPLLVEAAITNGATPGTVQYRWAQFTTDAGTPAIVRQGSQLRARRVV